MKKRVADIVVETLVELGINQCFCVVGGGAMHLNNAFELNEDMKITFCHHEQACAFAAEGYAKLTGEVAVVSVTSGPGAVNTLNGVYSAWVDSTPMIVIAGHPRLETTVAATGLKLRCRGVQEYDVIPTVQGMTKYAKMLTDGNTVREEIKKAYKIAMTGRRGPVWLSIPLDIQAMQIDVNDECEVEVFEDDGVDSPNAALKEVVERLKSAKRPCILTGSAIRFSGAMNDFLQFIERVQVPIVGGALLSDTLPEDYPHFYGLSGNIGPRAGNYILQNADFILVLGNSLSSRQTGFNLDGFAPDACFAMVDAEKDEMYKPGLRISVPIHMELKSFFNNIQEYLDDEIVATEEWEAYCKKAYSLLKGVDDPVCEKSGRVPAKIFWKVFREKIQKDAIIALGNSNGVIGVYQYGLKHIGQRVLTNYNAGSMGYDLPMAIGAAVVDNHPVYCVTGDGSIMMNLQEFETISHNKLPIKVVVFSNEGYGAIRQTCKNFFKGLYTGCDKASGVGMPDFSKVAECFDFSYICCKSCEELERSIEEFVKAEGNVLLQVNQLLDDPVMPKIMSKMKADGTFETPIFTDLYPYLDDEVVKDLEM